MSSPWPCPWGLASPKPKSKTKSKVKMVDLCAI